MATAGDSEGPAGAGGEGEAAGASETSASEAVVAATSAVAQAETAEGGDQDAEQAEDEEDNLPENLQGLSRNLAWLLRHARPKAAMKPDAEGNWCRFLDVVKSKVFEGHSLEDFEAVVQLSTSRGKARFELKREADGVQWIRATAKHSAHMARPLLPNKAPPKGGMLAAPPVRSPEEAERRKKILDVFGIPCRDYSYGVCKKGDMCRFTHAASTWVNPQRPRLLESAAVDPDVAAQQTADAVKRGIVQPFASSTPCRYFLHGLCGKGLRCNFLHTGPNLEHYHPKTKMCRWFKYGWCTHGDLCDYAHSEEERRLTDKEQKEADEKARLAAKLAKKEQAREQARSTALVDLLAAAPDLETEAGRLISSMRSPLFETQTSQAPAAAAAPGPSSDAPEAPASEAPAPAQARQEALPPPPPRERGERSPSPAAAAETGQQGQRAALPPPPPRDASASAGAKQPLPPPPPREDSQEREEGAGQEVSATGEETAAQEESQTQAGGKQAPGSHEREAASPWKKFYDESRPGYWYWKIDGAFFFEDSPSGWKRYCDSTSGKQYWYKEDGSDWFWDM